MSAAPSAGWQGPVRAAAALFVVGFLVIWLVKPIGNPCPDLDALPQGSSAHSSPSFAPPGSRICTYTAAGGTRATARYMPWLDWIVLLLAAAVAGGAVRALSPERRAPRRERTRAPRQTFAPAERDAAERERARRERAERNR